MPRSLWEWGISFPRIMTIYGKIVVNFLRISSTKSIISQKLENCFFIGFGSYFFQFFRRDSRDKCPVASGGGAKVKKSLRKLKTNI